MELISFDDSDAHYDIRGDGSRYRVSWVSPDDGILAYDRDGDGVISRRDEIAFVDYVEGAASDLEGLKYFDADGDNALTPKDAEWDSFRVWQDLDSDGVSDPGELRTLDEASIESISLFSDQKMQVLADGTTIFGRGSYIISTPTGPEPRELLDVALPVGERLEHSASKQ